MNTTLCLILIIIVYFYSRYKNRKKIEELKKMQSEVETYIDLKHGKAKKIKGKKG